MITDTTGWDVVDPGWIQTTLVISAGDVLTFTATGNYRPTLGGAVVNPTSVGCGTGRFNSKGYPATNVKPYAVAARIGTGIAFCIGGQRTLTAATSGILTLIMNDNDPSKALGSVVVKTVQVHQP